MVKYLVKVSCCPFAIVCASDKVNVVPLMFATVGVPVMPVPLTKDPTFISVFAADKVTDVLLLTAPLIVEFVVVVESVTPSV